MSESDESKVVPSSSNGEHLPGGGDVRDPDSEPEEEEAKLPAIAEQTKLSPSKEAKVDIERLVIAKATPTTPKPQKTSNRKSKEALKSEDEWKEPTPKTPFHRT